MRTMTVRMEVTTARVALGLQKDARWYTEQVLGVLLLPVVPLAVYVRVFTSECLLCASPLCHSAPAMLSSQGRPPMRSRSLLPD